MTALSFVLGMAAGVVLFALIVAVMIWFAARVDHAIRAIDTDMRGR